MTVKKLNPKKRGGRGQHRMTDLELFEKYCNRVSNGCWLWSGPKSHHGYGVIGHHYNKPRTTRAHRFSFQHYIAPIPKGMSVCHKCDVTSCVNPEHLFVGTHLENMQDAQRKGRFRGKPKVTPDDVRDIRERLAQGESQASIARAKKVSFAIVNCIKHGRTWRNLK